MKNAKALLAAVILLPNITVSGTALADDGVISKDQVEPGSYCHERFPAIEGNSLASNKPVLRSQNSETSLTTTDHAMKALPEKIGERTETGVRAPHGQRLSTTTVA